MKCKYETVMKRRITLRLTDDLFKRVEHYAHYYGEINTDTIRKMIEEYGCHEVAAPTEPSEKKYETV